MSFELSRHPRAALLASTILLAGAFPAVASATDAANTADAGGVGDVEEIIIVSDSYQADKLLSATKTPTALIDIPQSLSVLSKVQIADQGLNDIGDVLRYIPGASVGQGEGHRDQYTIRGQNTTADFYVDGLRDDVQYFRPLYNLERIEILRGSNALVFGRGGGGGVINRVTKAPDLEEQFTGYSAGVDTFGGYSFAGDVNAITSETSAFRLNGFYEDLNNHRDAFGGERFALNPTFLTRLSEDTQIVLSYEYVNDERVVDRGVPSLDGRPLRGFDDTFFGARGTNRTDFEGHIARARIDHSFNDILSFNTSVQYADYDKFYQNLFPIGFDGGANTVSLDGYRDTTERENLIIQSNFVAEFEMGTIKHTLLFGGEYADQQSENARRDILFADSNDDQITFAFSDPLNVPAFSFPVFNRSRESDVEVLSGYIQDQIEIGEHFQIVGGVRYDRFEIDVVDLIQVANGNSGETGRTDTEWSPRAGLIYKPLADVSFYTSYSRSFLPRSGDQFLSLSPTNANLAPEKFDNYEFGVKWDFLDKLSLTAAIFRLDRDGGTTVDPNDAGNTIVVGSRTEGFELQLVGELLEGWTVNAGYSYLDADERGRVAGGAIDNRTLSQVPEHMLSVWNRVQIDEKLAVGLGATYQDTQFASISNTVELPDYVRFDAAVYYKLSERVQVQVNIENLFDRDYFPAAHNDNNISTGEPFVARFSISGRF